jgi:hypothetical protein
MLPAIAPSMSTSLGFPLVASSALADMIWPDWQYPHCGTSSASQAAWIFLPAGVLPMASMVTIRFPTAEETGVTQDRVGCPSTWMVQAPHRPMPQPNLVPVMLSTSRSVHSNGMSSGISRSRGFPFTLSVTMSVPPVRGFRRYEISNLAGVIAHF